jgi:hypothetical protein
METVVNTIASAGSVASNTIASASSMATKAIWGDPNKESQNEKPKSGESGDVKAAELVDKGEESEDPNREGDTPLTDDHLYGKLGVLSGGDPLDKSTEGILGKKTFLQLNLPMRMPRPIAQTKRKFWIVNVPEIWSIPKERAPKRYPGSSEVRFTPCLFPLRDHWSYRSDSYYQNQDHHRLTKNP